MLQNINNFLKFFLIKEIKSKIGEIYFRRYALVETRWFSIYLHQILKSDEDQHCHDHPYNFLSLILSGGYFEEEPSGVFKLFRAWNLNLKKAADFHKITLVKSPTWTLVIAGRRFRTWGYWVEDQWIEASMYRDMKNRGELLRVRCEKKYEE